MKTPSADLAAFSPDGVGRNSSPRTGPAAPAAPWQPDRGDGTFQNPVLFADYSDPDVIRVGEDYWLIASSFSHVPGLPILHSSDLVNWTLVNHALPQLVPAAHFSVPRHGGGVWAPSLRFHADRFWIFYPDPDFGIYVVTASYPTDRWTEPRLVLAGQGLIDPCPFWDDDGQGYLIHGWAKSRAGIKNRLTLHRLRADNCAVTDPGQIVIDGDRMPGWKTIEGPKLHKRGDYYYIFAPAGGVKDGYQAVFRSRNLCGPYESKIVLAQGATSVNGPHQGAWIESSAGDHWFMHFQEMAVYGRVIHLQPLRWEEGWPEIGQTIPGHGPGEPILVGRKPLVGSAPRTGPATTDEFEQGIIGRQWQWQANPQTHWTSPRAESGSLCLNCVAHEPGHSLWTAPNLLMQKFPAPGFVVTTVFHFSPAHDGDAAGLIVFGHDYAWLGLRWRNGRLSLLLAKCLDAHQGGLEREIISREVTSPTIHLRVTVKSGGLCQFAASDGREPFAPIGPEFQAASSDWVGAKIGLFALASQRSHLPGGSVTVAGFHVTRPLPLISHSPAARLTETR